MTKEEAIKHADDGTMIMYWANSLAILKISPDYIEPIDISPAPKLIKAPVMSIMNIHGLDCVSVMSAFKGRDQMVCIPLDHVYSNEGDAREAMVQEIMKAEASYINPQKFHLGESVFYLEHDDSTGKIRCIQDTITSAGFNRESNMYEYTLRNRPRLFKEDILFRTKEDIYTDLIENM